MLLVSVRIQEPINYKNQSKLVSWFYLILKESIQHTHGNPHLTWGFKTMPQVCPKNGPLLYCTVMDFGKFGKIPSKNIWWIRVRVNTCQNFSQMSVQVCGCMPRWGPHCGKAFYCQESQNQVVEKCLCSPSVSFPPTTSIAQQVCCPHNYGTRRLVCVEDTMRNSDALQSQSLT